MINKLVANIKKTGAPIVSRTGSDAFLCTRAGTEKGICRVWRDFGRSSRSYLASSIKRSWIRLMI